MLDCNAREKLFLLFLNPGAKGLNGLYLNGLRRKQRIVSLFLKKKM